MIDKEEITDRLPYWAKELLKLEEESQKEKQQPVATDDKIGASCGSK